MHVGAWSDVAEDDAGAAGIAAGIATGGDNAEAWHLVRESFIKPAHYGVNAPAASAKTSSKSCSKFIIENSSAAQPLSTNLSAKVLEHCTLRRDANMLVLNAYDA